ncbi:arg8-vasotocin receptor-like [Octopus sinensis]|uniref:Arg8-vasotocin receptor-like n=1 Tax=Octopus sinensis TaxID=2607531 RepID=A0A6P7SA24_9MOLL|nr:arg8-vasotocin receptor-like [Octopus sinensis]
MTELNESWNYKKWASLSYTTMSISENDQQSFNKSSAESVHDKAYSKTLRLTCLYIMIIGGIIGGFLLLIWVKMNRRWKSRINILILNLSAADLSVIFFACTPQLVWEYVDREWFAGAFMCKLVKFMQSFSMMASTNMLIVIALDRHQAIRAPLRKPITIWKMAGLGWIVAALTSLPMLFVFVLVERNGQNRCENTFRNKPKLHRQIFLTYVAFVVFFIPLILLILFYARIFLKIAQKATENQSCNNATNGKPGKVHLQSTKSSSLPKAKIKTLKMTLVIVSMYIICWLPYFTAEMIMSYGNHKIISPTLYSILGGIAPINSAANPYIFLMFSVNYKTLNCPKWRRVTYTNPDSTRSHFISSSRIEKSDSYKEQYAKGCPTITVEMTTLEN